jgi:NAD(P)-dependent dehydrogenase (short-subunit alcohol dehydrogenase family)
MTAKNVLITGGTSGLGKHMGLAFAKAGYNVILTYCWGSADKSLLLKEFTSKGYPEPRLMCADVSDNESTKELMKEIKKEYEAIDVFVSNVSFAQLVNNIDDLNRASLHLTINYCAWPLVDYTQEIKNFFGAYPKYVIGISSDASHVCHPNYILSGCSKAVLDTLIRYLAQFLGPQGTHVNGISPGFFDTPSSRASLGDELVDRINQTMIPLDCDKIANLAVALSSGLMDIVNGEIITADEGNSHVSPSAFLKM